MRPTVWVVVGGVAGLAWGAALRAYMAEITGTASSVTWAGTFAGVLLPSVIVGAALAAASVARSRRLLRWCAASPLLFGVVPLLIPGALLHLLTTGQGSGAAAVSLAGLAGSYALGGRRRWVRIVLAGVFVILIAGLAASVPLIGGDVLAVTSPRGAWIMTLVASLLIMLALAGSVPFARLRERPAAVANPLRNRV